MRLDPHQRQIIRNEVARVFGSGARIQLFGSRLDDAQRGGDIDLYIEADGAPAELLDRELTLHAGLQRQLGEQRIDIVVHRRGNPFRQVDRHARETGVAI